MLPKRQRRDLADAAADAIARLVTAAAEDPDFRKRLLFVIRLPPFHRASVIATAVQEMRLKGENAADILAFAALADDAAASKLESELEARS